MNSLRLAGQSSKESRTTGKGSNPPSVAIWVNRIVLSKGIEFLASLPVLAAALDISRIARQIGYEVPAVASVYFAAGDRFGCGEGHGEMQVVPQVADSRRTILRKCQRHAGFGHVGIPAGRRPMGGGQ